MPSVATNSLHFCSTSEAAAIKYQERQLASQEMSLQNSPRALQENPPNNWFFFLIVNPAATTHKIHKTASHIVWDNGAPSPVIRRTLLPTMPSSYITYNIKAFFLVAETTNLHCVQSRIRQRDHLWVTYSNGKSKRVTIDANSPVTSKPSTTFTAAVKWVKSDVNPSTGILRMIHIAEREILVDTTTNTEGHTENDQTVGLEKCHGEFVSFSWVARKWWGRHWRGGSKGLYRGQSLLSHLFTHPSLLGMARLIYVTEVCDVSSLGDLFEWGHVNVTT